MTEKKKKLPKIDTMIEAGEQIGEGVKKVAPAEVDAVIDRGVQIAKAGNYLKKALGSIFGKSKLF